MDKELLRKYENGEIKVHGNCQYHNTYEWPDKVFCFSLYGKNKNPIVLTLGEACEEWRFKDQECYCVQEALKKQGSSKV